MHVNKAIEKLLEGKKIRRKFWPSYMFERISKCISNRISEE